MKHAFRLQYALLAALIGFGFLADARDSGNASVVRIGAPQDWSSRAIVFPHPETPLEASRGNAAHAGRIQRLAKDPRYVLALARRFSSEADAKSMSMASNVSPAPAARGRGRPLRARNALHRDWSNVLGGINSGSGANGIFPAKYNFDISATPDCANDFIVYPTDAAGADNSGAAETRTGTFSDRPNANRTITIGTAPRSVTLTAVDTVTSNLQWARGGNGGTSAQRAAINAANLAAAVNAWTGQTGITATDLGNGVVRFARTSAGDDASGLPYTGNLNNFSMSGTTAGSGTGGQPTIVAFNQLYNTTCNAGRGNSNAPNVMWAYNTGTGYITETSPVLSYFDNAKQVAFVQRNGNTLQLVLLKWQLGQGTAAAPATPALSASAAAYRSCAANCYYAITFNGTSNTDGAATYSSPFVDYLGDVLYVGDGNGRLHKFTGVFSGSPAEVASGGFPATVVSTSGIKLSPPIYDFAGNVFIGSQSGAAGVGGALHRVDASNGTVATSAKLANNNTIGLRDTPLLDASTNSVFAFLFNDGSAGDGTNCITTSGNPDACRVVARFSTTFANGASPLQRAYVGRGNSTVSTLYSGAFDDAYYNSGNGTGSMYIVGGAAADTFLPTLWKIPLTGGVMGTPIAGAVVGSNDCNAVGDCLTNNWDWSPVTLVKNGGNEYMYFSMGKKGSAAGCTGACVYMFNLNDLNGSAAGTGAAWGNTNAASAGLPVYGGTGGIVVDNISGTAGTSQVYFSHVNSPGNAVQASQSALN